jgi:Zn-dependent protease with chaperone function
MTSLLLAGVTLVAGCSLAVLSALARRALGRLTPRTRAWCAAACLAAGTVLTGSGLVLLAVPAVFELLPRRALGGWRFQGAGPAGMGVAWLAGCLLLSSAAAAAVRAVRWRRERRVLRVDDGVGEVEHRAGFDLVTLPGAAVIAYSIGGRQPQVVLSQGLHARLDHGGLAAVVDHEEAHLRAHHDRWLRLVSLATAALWFVPGMGRAASALRLCLEQWADQHAAATAGPRALHAALLSAAGVEAVPAQVAALSGADMLAERLALLTDGRPHGAGRARLRHVSSLTAMVGSATSGTGGLVAALVVLQHLCT